MESSVEDWSVKSRKSNLPLKKCLEKHECAFVLSRFNFGAVNGQKFHNDWTYSSLSSILPSQIWFSSRFWAIFHGGFRFQPSFIKKKVADTIFISCLPNLRLKIAFSCIDSKIFHWRNVWERFIEYLLMIDARYITILSRKYNMFSQFIPLTIIKLLHPHSIAIKLWIKRCKLQQIKDFILLTLRVIGLK